mgnify:CR=1 FL=1
MIVSFHKMHGLGNDFVVVDTRSTAWMPDSDLVRALAERRTGIGCDQLLLLVPPTDPDCAAGVLIRNADGEPAEQCGNGLRCVALLLDRHGELDAGSARLQTPGGEVIIERAGNHGYATLLPPPRLPDDDRATPLTVTDETIAAYRVDTGNPHAVVLSQAPDADRHRLGRALSEHPTFAGGCNAGFAALIDADQARLSVWERGAGPTRACGTGAAAAAAVLIRYAGAAQPLHVTQPGGRVVIEWRQPEGPLRLAGPADHVFTGRLDPTSLVPPAAKPAGRQSAL